MAEIEPQKYTLIGFQPSLFIKMSYIFTTHNTFMVT